MAKATARSLAGLTNDLSDDELLELTDNVNRPELRQFLSALAVAKADATFVTALSDDEVSAKFPQFKKAVAPWRKYAASVGYTGPVAWRVREGFTLKIHAPKAGPCYDQLDYLKNWSLKNDEPTKNALVFWVPRLVKESLIKTTEEQKKALLSARWKFHQLPEHHCTSFGSIALLFALILAHFKRTGERVPLTHYYAASDSSHESGSWLVAGNFGEDGLACYDWHGSRVSSVGFFLLGMEPLGN